MHANALNWWSFAITIDRNFNNLSLLFDLEVLIEMNIIVYVMII